MAPHGKLHDALVYVLLPIFCPTLAHILLKYFSIGGFQMDKVLIEKPVGANGALSVALKALAAVGSFKYKLGWLKLDVGAEADVEGFLLWLKDKIPGKLDDAAIGIVLEFLKKDEPAKPAV